MEGPGIALVVGGSGMLTECVARLVDRGWHVVVPSRRHAPIPVPRDHEASQAGRAIWVAADWQDSSELRRRVAQALPDLADLLVAWLPPGDRATVLDALSDLLRPTAAVVEVQSGIGSAHWGRHSRRYGLGCAEPALPNHPTQRVMLGCVKSGGRTRWLTRSEIAEGIRDAVDRALAGRSPVMHQVGEPHPWLLH